MKTKKKTTKNRANDKRGAGASARKAAPAGKRDAHPLRPPRSDRDDLDLAALDAESPDDGGIEGELVADGVDDVRAELGVDAAHTPVLSGGDVDAGYDQADSGEETVGGSAPTPDQDVVDELGAAAGLTFQEEEPIGTDKLERRDDERWELDPASSEDYEERSQKLKTKKRPIPPS